MAVNTKVRDFKKNLIIDTAYDLFTQHTFEKVTVEDIALEAGFGKSTVYLFFESKEEILAAVIRLGIEKLARAMQSISDNEPDVREALRLMIPLQYDYMSKFGHLSHTFAHKCKDGIIKADWIEDTLQAVSAKTDSFTKVIKKGVDQGIFISWDPHELTWMVISMIKGVCIPGILKKTELRNREQEIELLNHIIFNGISVKE